MTTCTKSSKGFTLVEVLIGLGITSIILTLLGTYLQANTDLKRRIEVRTEVQDRVRQVADFVTQDLQMIGAKRYINGSSVTTPSAWQSCSSANPCLSGVQDSINRRDVFGGRYITSLLPSADSCRRFEYSFSDLTWLRREWRCQDLPPAFDVLAENILAFEVLYVCSNQTTRVTPNCGSNLYLRSARFAVVGRSNVKTEIYQNPTIALPSGASVTCPSEFICFVLSQEVAMPNLQGQVL